ncbi:hypothetical protein D3870_00220 [Noviherbaspirillum cavernae]|uniref:Glycosyltransferase RgtA/B/C/D-like domain-containing protein n=1 Tax=Noviherbaspirillum cavernae TaxID=2320862 RepID=A0A418WWT0_9BURK|nr:hypothetical protein [Noviherbaspirillum cavernae]RJG04652.1 hypothetical protein D3870_00220 [Noviherbaspirillum cavernae]
MNNVSATIASTNVIEQQRQSGLRWIALAVPVVASFAALVWILARMRHGFDFTDESFYLIWISSPWSFDISATQFGFVYHPLYRLVGGDIALLRQANALITCALAWGLLVVFFRTAARQLSLAEGMAISAALSLSSLLSLVTWLPTPSYNSLALQALLVAAIGILLTGRESVRASVIGYVLIGVAGWLTFMAKPTSAAMLGVVVPCYLLLARKLNFRRLLISVATAVVLWCSSAALIDGSLHGFIARLTNAIELYKMVGAGHTASQIFRLGEFALTENEKVLLKTGIVIVFLPSFLLLLRNEKARLIGAAMALMSFLASIGMVFGMFEDMADIIPPSSFQGLLIASVPFGVVLISLVKLPKESFVKMTQGNFSLGLCFLLLPYVYAFGSNNNYWYASAGAGLFWILAGVVRLAPALPRQAAARILLSIAAGAQLITLLLVNAGMEHPYRQPQALRLSQELVRMGVQESPLLLSPIAAQYVRQLKHTAQESGFVRGEPVIDLTGHAPGAVFALGGRAIGQPWLVGGYKGSEGFVKASLDRASCDDIAKAWILIEPAGSRALSPLLMERYGIHVAQNYRAVGSFVSPEPVPAVLARPDLKQYLLKPVHSPERARIACEQMRVRPS